MRKSMYPKLKEQRIKRQRARYKRRWRRKYHPSHMTKYGHRFVLNTEYDKKLQICKKCGKSR